MVMANLTMRTSSTTDLFSDEASFSRIFGQLNPEFVAAFKDTGTLYDVLREFVYGMDHLDEITKMKGFKTNKMLESPDCAKMGQGVKKMFNTFAKFSKEAYWRMVPISQEISNSLQEFFNQRYITDIYLMMLRMCNSELEFTLDGNPYIVHIDVETPHFGCAVLDYIDVNRKVVVRIPFMKERLRQALAMQR